MKFIVYSTPKVVNYDKEIILNIENKLKNNEAITEDEVYYILDYICYVTRCKISNDIKNDSFENKDFEATSIINNYFKELNVITHNCNTKLNINNDVTENNFLIVEINTLLYNQNLKIPYIIDVTFRQFFTEEKCNYNYQTIKHNVFIKKQDPGYFISPYDNEMITSFLSDGYALFDPDLAYCYGNAFLKTKINEHLNNHLEGKMFDYFDNFLKGSKYKLLDKDKLIKKNLLIEPIKNKELKRCNTTC
jgi:hypothetical protein